MMLTQNSRRTAEPACEEGAISCCSALACLVAYISRGVHTAWRAHGVATTCSASRKRAQPQACVLIMQSGKTVEKRRGLWLGAAEASHLTIVEGSNTCRTLQRILGLLRSVQDKLLQNSNSDDLTVYRG